MTCHCTQFPLLVNHYHWNGVRSVKISMSHVALSYSYIVLEGEGRRDRKLLLFDSNHTPLLLASSPPRMQGDDTLLDTNYIINIQQLCSCAIIF